MTTYRAVMLTRKGGPEVLQVVDLPLEPPGAGELRIRVSAAGVGATDVSMLNGNYPFAPKIPFVPGYEAAGVVDAIGPGVSGFALGQRVAALTVYGGFAEFLTRAAEHFLPVPEGVEDRDAAAVILNFATAWQMIHRVAKVQEGQTALVTGASGGVGTAALQLLKLAGLKTYGAASASKHELVRSLGAIPIDYKQGRLDTLIRRAEPGGVDFVFDAVGGRNIGACIVRCAREGWLSALASWALPECSRRSPCSRISSLGRVCAGAVAISTAFLRCTGRTPSRFAKTCPRSLNCSGTRRSTRRSSTPSRCSKREKQLNC